jgi:hypothetical protein
MKEFAKSAVKWVTLLGLVGIVGYVVYRSIPDFRDQMFSHSSPRATCSSLSASFGGSSARPPGLAAQATTAKLQPHQTESVAFGRSVTTRTITLYFDLSAAPDGPTNFHVRTNAFVRADDASLCTKDIVATAKDAGRTLILNVTFSRYASSIPSLGDPGLYVGSVTIDDSRLGAPVTIPMTVTMQYIDGVFLLWLYFAAILPGAWCVWVIRNKIDGKTNAFSLEFLKWAIKVDGIVALVSGGVAAFAVYVAVYLRDPTWGSSALQPLTLYGAMFSAFVTTSGLASLTGTKT